MDSEQIQTWIDASAYDVRGDLDLDGDVDASDKSASTTTYGGEVSGRDKLSGHVNQHGWGGSIDEAHGLTHRKRSTDPGLGRWLLRDPLGYVDGENLYQYCLGSPIALGDPMGAQVSFWSGSPAGFEGQVTQAGLDLASKSPTFKNNIKPFYEPGRNLRVVGKKPPLPELVGLTWPYSGPASIAGNPTASISALYVGNPDDALNGDVDIWLDPGIISVGLNKTKCVLAHESCHAACLAAQPSGTTWKQGVENCKEGTSTMCKCVAAINDEAGLVCKECSRWTVIVNTISEAFSDSLAHSFYY